MEERFLNLNEVAGRLGVTYATVWRMVLAGEIRAIKVRSLWRVPESALDELAAEGVAPHESRG